ncbi:MAG: four helix bundle protein [Anaerolineaceae bacterium]|nr:four helix bundle protein [Anaerolineaceae bacterium]
MLAQKIQTHRDLEVYQRAFSAAMAIFDLSKQFSKEESYSLTDQIRRSSRSVCANLAEAWRKRRYEKAFISKLSDAESEAAETQVWLEFAVKCSYLDRETAADLYLIYDGILATFVGMINHHHAWVLPGKKQGNHPLTPSPVHPFNLSLNKSLLNK